MFQANEYEEEEGDEEDGSGLTETDTVKRKENVEGLEAEDPLKVKRRTGTMRWAVAWSFCPYGIHGIMKSHKVRVRVPCDVM